jgi:hypothetical protein
VGATATAAYFLLAFGQRSEHQHFNDGTFVLGDQVIRTFLTSAARGIWIWGGLSFVVITIYRERFNYKLLAFATLWFLASLLPYSFLTYMPRIPSRHHYLASVGMAIIVATAFLVFMQQRRHRAVIATILACVFIAHNWAYLWLWKKPQFEWRASLVEDFVRFVAQPRGQPVVNRCRELNSGEASRAIHYRLGRDSDVLLLANAEPGASVYKCRASPSH